MNQNILKTHVENGLSTREIAAKMNCGQTNVRHWMKKYGLKTQLKQIGKGYDYSKDNGPKQLNSNQKLIETGFRKCSECLETKKIENFYLRPSGYYNSQCKQCMALSSIERQKQIKYQSVEYKGGKCSVCGYSKCIAALDFHHPDPTVKDFHIGFRKCASFETLKPELDKCILVCANCHGEIHGGIIKL